MSEAVYPQAELVLARALYPTAWGCGGAAYTPKSALEHTRAALRGLRRAGYQISRTRLGAGYAVPQTAALLKALHEVSEAKTLDDAKRAARQALKASS